MSTPAIEPEEYESICGETYDHTERLTYSDAETEQWECINCGAEWWQDMISSTDPWGRVK